MSTAPTSAESTFRQIVIDLIQNDTRFADMASYCHNLEFFWSHSIPTACAGYGFIFFNPDFWNNLKEDQRATVVAHEIEHLMRDHLDRGAKMEPSIYNQAADHVINLSLQDEGYDIDMESDFAGTTPCCDPQYKGMSTNQIYSKIYEEVRKNPDYQPTPSPDPTADEIKELIKTVLNGSQTLEEAKAADQAAKDGAISELEQNHSEEGGTFHTRLLQDIIPIPSIKKAQYLDIFKKYLTDPLGGKRTFLQPSRKPSPTGLRMKGHTKRRGEKHRLGHLVYALDVSGSITHQQSNAFLSSAATIKKLLNPKLMTVILWNASIKFEKIFTESESLDNIPIQAGGSTNLRPVYDRCRILDPEAVVIFTDLQVSVPPKPDWDTIWFIPDRNVPDQYLQQVTYGDLYLVPELNK